MTNSTIANNTVIDQVPEDDVNPWIMIHDHKNGTPSNNCLIANNIVFRSLSYNEGDVVASDNYIIGQENYDQVYELFADPVNFDMHLLQNAMTDSLIIDQGMVYDLVSSEIDKDKHARTVPPDLGAFEVH